MISFPYCVFLPPVGIYCLFLLFFIYFFFVRLGNGEDLTRNVSFLDCLFRDLGNNLNGRNYIQAHG